MKLFIGIDPGSKGAIFISNERNEVVDFIDMPTRYLKEDEFYKKTGKKKKRKDGRRIIDTECIYNFLSPYAKNSIGFIENVSSREGDGKASAFTFGTMFQGPKSVMECLGIPYYQITPQVWQKHFNFTKGDAKEQSLATASNIFGSDTPFKGPRGGAKDGRSDAYLISCFGHEAITQEKHFWVSRHPVN